MDTNIRRRAVPLDEHSPANNIDGAHDAIAAELHYKTSRDALTNLLQKPRLTIGEAAKSVGAWENASGYVCFGSWDAVRAFAMKMQRDLALAHFAEHPSCANGAIPQRAA